MGAGRGVQRIPFEESTWKDPYHQRGPWDD
ncbi:hypothetical protein MICRO80W_720010 [Micrococcus luteus]|nr:hypothetical protein MICRO80W_720010 [Micrococcus luteus]